MKIIIPTDFSENAYKAVSYVYDHFEKKDIEISLIHTVLPPSSSRGVMIRIDDIMEEDAHRNMDMLLKRIKESYDHEPEPIIRGGHLKDWVEQVSKITTPDLIVMGTKGENDIASKLMGSVTESIVRTSVIPVLGVPSDYVSSPVNHITISSALDKLKKQDFIAKCISNLKDKHVHLEILRVILDPSQNAPRSVKMNGLEVPVEAIRSDSPVNGINSYLDENNVDLLCLFHSKNGRLDYLFNRSVTKTICARVKLPLLIIPDHP